MSTPLWRRPPDLGKPHESMNDAPPCTGQMNPAVADDEAPLEEDDEDEDEDEEDDDEDEDEEDDDEDEDEEDALREAAASAARFAAASRSAFSFLILSSSIFFSRIS